MMMKSIKFLLMTFLLVSSILFSLNFISADFAGCWQYGDTDSTTCTTSGGSNCQWTTPANDPWCDSSWNSIGCCMDKGCWNYDGTDSSTCTTNDGTMNCTWDPIMTMYYSNGSQSPPGGCMTDYSSGEMTWGGMSEGCWNYDADKSSCTSSANAQKCSWNENDANQNSWCWIKNLADAQNENPSAILADVGCCEMKGCWNYDGNQTACEDNTAFKGLCSYDSTGDWCMTKSCNEVIGESNCTTMTQNLMMPCSWDGDSCEDSYGGGGFGFYNDTDSCMSVGGWYNSTGACVMPTGTGFGAGGGGYMFASETHCWFADNQPNICGNLTGCAYCVSEGDSDGAYDITNVSSDNICANKPVGFCEGHDTWDRIDYTNADNAVSLNCSHIGIKSACEYGPLPSCKWTNSSISTGSFCIAGTSSAIKSLPPVTYCEDPTSKNNYTMCNDLATKYMMPCKWDNSSAIVKNCTFNSKAVFGNDNEIEYEIITNENSCTAAGGTWNSEYYIENDILKQDAWCEMTGFFDLVNSQGMSGKSNCDENCWACEFQSNGSAWGTQSLAETACLGSALNYCKWTNDTTSSFNGLGWCDYPPEMEDGGAKDCNSECEGCNFMATPYDSCIVSPANNGTGCKWANESGTSAGACVDKTKKICDSDCFSCYDFDGCNASSISCAWDSSFGLCKPQGFSGEICFDGVDNDGDSLTDCADPDCGFDNFCGGSNVGGDCFQYTSTDNCNNALAYGSSNCTWLNETWNTDGWCDMPGANCWKFDNNLTLCGATTGCTNDSSSMGMSNFCDLNMTLQNDANCWSNNYGDCITANNCAWKNYTNWETGEDMAGGWCDFAPYAQCMNLNVSNCNGNNNCTWNTDEYSMVGGWCDVACYNHSLSGSACNNAGDIVGLCETRDASTFCQPSTFMMMGTTIGGKSGCWQYDGNQTGCNLNNITCTYQTDSFANNNISVGGVNSGWCMDKSEYQHFGDMKGAPVMLAMDSGNVNGASESGVSGWVDLIGTGIRVTADAFSFGGSMFNISEAMMCNGYNVGIGPGQTPTTGSGIETTNFYWYLDTNGVETGGCNGTDSSLSNVGGFEFYIVYSARNTSTGLKETKQLRRCSSGIWTTTNTLITTSKKMSCGEVSGVMVGVDKQGLEAFSEYNKTTDMRIMLVSANATDNRTNPSDSVGPGYYTQGSIDFSFVDCSDPTTKDPKCKNIQKFGFNVFEECMNGVDDDENGLIDCNDPFCVFTPKCASGTAFTFNAISGDNTAPTVVFNEIEKLHNMATIKTDTNEPTNMTLEFYRNDSQCLAANINSTLFDVGSDFAANANFKPFHYLTLDDNSLGYDLVNGTIYYYKIKVCDTSENCAISACSNFTTKKKASYKPFIFKMDLPAGYTVDIPALNKTGYNFTETFTINGVDQTFDVGIKTNASVTKNINITIHCGDQSIGFYGVDILKPSKIDLTNAFICDQTNNLMGMNSSLKKWNNLISDLGIGGASDYLEIGLPVAYSASNTFKWTDDGGSNPQTVDSYTSCSGNTTLTTCKVPVSMGFSAYTLTLPASDDSSPSGGGGGGGGSAAVASGGLIYTISETQFKDGYTRSLGTTDRIKFSVGGEFHSVLLDEIQSDTVKVTIASDPQIATLSVGDLRKFDVTDDNYYDLSVVLESIDTSGNSTAQLTIKSIYEVVTEETIKEEKAKEESAVIEQEEKDKELENNFEWKFIYSKWLGGLVGIIVLLVVLKLGWKKFNEGNFFNLTNKIRVYQKKSGGHIKVKK